MTAAKTGITHRTFISYIDRTRTYYHALGYMRPYRWARFADVPFAPLSKPLGACRVAVVTTASPWGAGANSREKRVWSGPVEPPPERLYTDDLSWDKETTHMEDVGSFLPLAALGHWAAAGRIAGLTTRFHGVPTSYSHRQNAERDAPELLRRCREDGADVVLLVPI